MDTNLDGTFLCYRAAARQMLKKGRGGRIIGTVSQLKIIQPKSHIVLGASSAYGKQGQHNIDIYQPDNLLMFFLAMVRLSPLWTLLYEQVRHKRFNSSSR